MPALLCLPIALLFSAPAGAEALECVVDRDRTMIRSLQADLEAGRIASPAIHTAPAAVRSDRSHTDTPPYETSFTHAQVFVYEDTASLLTTDFTEGQLYNLMAQAANALIATHGDNFDFVGYWLNFPSHHQIGAAHYEPIENDVSGIGLSPFNDRAMLGLSGSHVEGFAIFWNIHNGWAAGDLIDLNFTRRAVAHEFEHRFAVFLPDLLSGRRLQGDNAGCGRSVHWSWRVDGQGSCMEVGEWISQAPAKLHGTFMANTDTTSVFSFTDLYLMGYVTPAEMDAGNGELRYMDTADCSLDYNGTMTPFTSADIIDTAGPRSPDAAGAQKHFRTAWIMLHLPGDPPDAAELDRVIPILEGATRDWTAGTLGRGSMSHALFDDCNGNGVEDAADIGDATSNDADADGIPDECRAPCGDGTDTDSDGVGDECDNCAALANFDQRDADDDGVGDGCDNCPGLPNRDQPDRDGDSFGDRCDSSDNRIDLFFIDDKSRPRWQVERNHVAWNLYRGDLGVLRSGGDYLQAPGSNALAAQFCSLSLPSTADDTVPAPGTTAFYLVTATAVNGLERFLGRDSANAPRPAANRCP